MECSYNLITVLRIVVLRKPYKIMGKKRSDVVAVTTYAKLCHHNYSKLLASRVGLTNQVELFLNSYIGNHNSF